MRKYLITIKGGARELAQQVNRLHAEISTLMLDSVIKAIKAGELLSELKLRVGHGAWRSWVEKNLHFSYRTARRYIHAFNHREELLKGGTKSLYAAQKLLDEGRTERGMDATGADYRKIERDLVKPVRVVRGRLRKTTYQGDDDQKIAAILATLREEALGLVEDLKG